MIEKITINIYGDLIQFNQFFILIDLKRNYISEHHQLCNSLISVQ